VGLLRRGLHVEDTITTGRIRGNTEEGGIDAGEGGLARSFGVDLLSKLHDGRCRGRSMNEIS
jgi:hypothetical protein